MPSQQNTYRKLDRDTAKNKVDKQSMYDCRNLRILGDNPNESGALVNIPGNEELQMEFPGYPTDSCIGSRQLRDRVILISTNSSSLTPSGTYGRLWIWDFKNDTTPTPLYNGLLNLSKAYPIGENIITRYESAEVQKVYWADGYNNLRYANVADPDLASQSPDDFNIVNEVDFVAPTFVEILGGKIPVGRVQYAFRLYRKYGGQSIFSPASKMINLTTSSEGVSNTSLYRGADRLDEDGSALSSGKAVQMIITDIDQNYDKIEIVAIHYSDILEAPNIYIVQLSDISNIIYFTDTGVYNQGYYSLSEYVALSNIFTPKTLATKNNILFVGNVTEHEFDVEYDARAYRYTSIKRAWIKDSGGGELYVNYANYPNPPVITPNASAPYTATLADIPVDWDCIQDINDITLEPEGISEIYKPDGDLGGEGVNVSYIFKNIDFVIDNSSNGKTFHVDGANIPFYFRSYASPYNSGYKLGYPRDEIYRFGAILFNGQGQPSPVKLIGDIRMPNNTTIIGTTDNRHSYTLTGDTYGTRLSLEFTLNNLPDTVTGYQIVRVERKPEDRTILFQGKMSFMGDIWGGTRSVRPPQEATAGDYHNVGNTSNDGRRNLWVSAPEISFYKDFKAASGDYLQIIGYYNNRDETVYGANDWHRVNKYNEFVPLAYDVHYRRNVEEAVVVETTLSVDEEVDVNSFTDISYGKFIRRTVNPSLAQEGNTGTAALINVADGFSVLSIPSGAYIVVNYRRAVVQYGGNTYEAKINNKFIAASEYIPKTSSSMVNGCYGGDSYIQFFDHLHAYYNAHYAGLSNFDSLCYVDMFPVETTINLDLRHDDCWHRIYNSNDQKYYIKEVGNASFTVNGIDYVPGWTDYYLYNTVFSRLENSRLYIPVPADWQAERESDSKVMASNAKYNNEEVDAWTQFPINEVIEVDGGYGVVKYLVVWNNTLLFFQEKGFGTLAVLERSLIQDNEGRNLTLGEGDVLQRYDMISSETGCSTRGSLIVTPNALIWYDNKQRRMHRLLKGIEDMGVINGMNSYFKSIADNIGESDNTLMGSFSGFLIGYNAKFNEVWFTVKTYYSAGETLVFNEILDDFTLFIDNNHTISYINQDNLFMCQRLNGYIYKENSDAVARGSFFGVLKDAIVEVIINPAGTLIHTLTNLELTTEILDNSDVNKVDEAISKVHITNDYQDTGDITLVPGTNIRRLMRTWRFNAIRDASYNARMRDTYHKIKLTYENSSVNQRKIILHDLISIYAMPVEALSNKQ